jgi:RNA 2',3'-cyclic 3'-phosphodiesterase
VADTAPEPRGSLRLFVAIELPGEVREALSRLQHDLQRRGLEKLRWVRPEGIHLTLKFLGATPAQKVPAIEESLAETVEGERLHELTLGELGTFGGSRPRVLWLDLRGDLDAAFTLQERVEKAMNGLGYEREARGWSPHLTLARVRPELARDAAKALPAALDGVRAPIGAIPVREVSLMRSTLRPSGAVYERIAAFSLRAP